MTEERIDNHELASFVTSTLNAIATGVESASSDTKRFSVPTEVNFEIAVTATKSTSGGGGLKLQVFSVEGKASKSDEEISRISFRVHTDKKDSGGPVSYGNRGIV